MMSFRPALAAHGLTKRYGNGTTALSELDIAVPEGSITALVGPNGAGKSTLMKAWIGFERPTQGKVTILGIDPWRQRAQALKRVGYVPQSPALYQELSVADHLEIARALRPSFDRASALARLADLQIPPSKRAGALSGGQQAQVCLAIALGTCAEVLILDEPLASLDPLARREFLTVMSDDVRRRGATAVLSSHVISDIVQACDRLVVLTGGRKRLDADIAEILRAYVVRPASDQRKDAPLTFLGETGQRQQLVRVAGGNQEGEGRPATLEEVVISHLVEARTS
jgi:ABC-2 type transport system ATP-binding protein